MPNWIRYLGIIGILASFLIGCPLWADDPSPSSITADLKADTTNTTDFNLDADFALHQNRILVGVEKTQAPTTPAQPDSLDTSELRLGVGTDFSDELAATFNYALWGQKGQIGSNSFSVAGAWTPKDWSFKLEPGIRFISIYLTDQTVLLRRTRTNSDWKTFSDPFVTGSIKYLGLENWNFSVKGSYYGYNFDLNELNSPQYAKFFSVQAVSLSANFLRLSAGVGAGYRWDKISLDASYSYSVAQIDDSISNTYSLKVGLFFFKDIDFDLEAGQTLSANSSAVNFVSGSGTFYW